MRSILWLAGLIIFIQSAFAADYSFKMSANGMSSWTFSNPSSPDINGGSGVENTTINLIVGKRYAIVSLGAVVGHPFQVIAKGSSSVNDIVLLAEGSAVGSLESDSGINWTDDSNGNLQFTVTSGLVAAMTQSGHTTGYRCEQHPDAMRGNFAIFNSGSVIADPLPPIPLGTQSIGLQTVVTSMTAPLGILFPNDNTSRAFVYEQNGFVRVLESSGTLRTVPFLNCSSRLVPIGAFGPGSYDERGLIGMALHPNFGTAGNNKIYTHTSEPVSGTADFTVTHSSPFDHQEVIAEWSVSTTDTNQINPATRRELMRIDHPDFNHNGGTMAFGKDGYLYIGMGDGGTADDEGNGHDPAIGNGQNTNVILGKILRIDVAGNNSTNGKYGIPADNPFVSSGGLKEIFVSGVRNPYSFTVDKVTGQIFLGEVGQNDIEEIDILTSASKGKNLGWRLKEGTFFFDSRGTSDGVVVTQPVMPLPSNLLEPIAEYDHRAGPAGPGDGIAIVAGYIYRGTAPSLAGKYIFGDLAGPSFFTPGGRLFYLDTGNQIKEFRLPGSQSNLGLFIKGFGQDLAGDIYVCASGNLAPFLQQGQIIKIIPGPVPTATHNWTLFK